MSPFDYLVVGIYLAFMAAIGVTFRRFNTTSSDYFRCGGNVVWWMVGATAFMTQFSSWTFTGAAGRAYTDGPSVLFIYLGNALGYVLAARWSAARFRQMRVVTPMEGIRDRFGGFNEQFFTWLWIPLGIIYAAIWLGSMGTFAAAVFGIDQTVTVFVVGIVIVVTATVGGGGAVVASDFIQMIILFPVSLVAAFLAIQAVGAGDIGRGLTQFVERLPDTHQGWTAHGYPQLVVFWIAATLLKQVCTTNNMNDSYRFLCAIDSTAARRASLMASALFVVGPIIWFVPPIAAAMLYPELAVIPQLARLGARAPEGAYVAIGLQTMPAGMIGLMAAAIFGVTMSSMDTGLNKCAGILVRSVYRPLIRRDAAEREYVMVGQLATVLCGVLVLLAALAMQSQRRLQLFDLMMLFSSMAVIPFVLPLIWGILVKHTPDWSAWSTVGVGLVTSAAAPSLLQTAAARAWLGLDTPIPDRVLVDYLFAGTLFLNVSIGSIWFLTSTLFARWSPPEHAARRAVFAQRIATPVVHRRADAYDRSLALVRSVARLCVPYGALVTLFACIPNTLAGRLCFIGVGAFVCGVGLVLRRLSDDPRHAAEMTAQEPAQESEVA